MKKISTDDVRPNKSGKLPLKFYRRAADLTMIVDEALRPRCYRVGVQGRDFVERISSGEWKDGLPELEEFSLKWGLRFPIPISLEIPLEGIMSGPLTWPVKILKRTSEVLVLQVYGRIRRGIGLEFVGGALELASRKLLNTKQESRRLVSRKPGLKRSVKLIERAGDWFTFEIGLPADKAFVQREIGKLLGRAPFSLRSRNFYEEVFRVVDLRNNKPKPTLIKIATRLWPDSKKIDEPESLTRSVRDLLDTFNSLAEKFRVPLTPL